VAGPWFTSSRQAGRVLAAAAVLGVLDAAASSFSSRAGRSAELALLRAVDVPLAAALAALVGVSAGKSTASAIVCSLPATLGLAAALLLASQGVSEEESVSDDSFLPLAGQVFASVCRAARCGIGACLLRQLDHGTSAGGWLAAAGFSTFFGSLVALPLTLGLDSPRAVDLDPKTGKELLQIALLSAAVLVFASAEAVARLAVLRHSKPVTAAVIDVGLWPMAAIMARACSITAHDQPCTRTIPYEVLALLPLLFSFLLQLRSVHAEGCISEGTAQDTKQTADAHPVLLGRPRSAHFESLKSRKVRDV